MRTPDVLQHREVPTDLSPPDAPCAARPRPRRLRRSDRPQDPDAAPRRALARRGQGGRAQAHRPRRRRGDRRLRPDAGRRVRPPGHDRRARRRRLPAHGGAGGAGAGGRRPRRQGAAPGQGQGLAARLLAVPAGGGAGRARTRPAPRSERYSPSSGPISTGQANETCCSTIARSAWSRAASRPSPPSSGTSGGPRDDGLGKGPVASNNAVRRAAGGSRPLQSPWTPLTHPRAALALALIVALGGCSASIGGRGAGASVGTPIGTVGVGTDGSLEGSRVGVRIGRWWDF